MIRCLRRWRPRRLSVAPAPWLRAPSSSGSSWPPATGCRGCRGTSMSLASRLGWESKQRRNLTFFCKSFDCWPDHVYAFGAKLEAVHVHMRWASKLRLLQRMNVFLSPSNHCSLHQFYGCAQSQARRNACSLQFILVWI